MFPRSRQKQRTVQFFGIFLLMCMSVCTEKSESAVGAAAVFYISSQIPDQHVQCPDL